MTCGDNEPCLKSKVQRKNAKQEHCKHGKKIGGRISGNGGEHPLLMRKHFSIFYMTFSISL